MFLTIELKTGATVELSGIYKCLSCKNEITCVKGDKCPPCRKCNNTEFKLIRAAK